MAGPTVRAWAGVARVETVAAESFVPGRSLMPTPLSISAPSGLRSVSVFNGAELFRRFVIPPGQSHFFDTLMLEASVHRTLTLVVEDRLGRVAITSVRRAWKSGRRSVVFCTDQCVPCLKLNFLCPSCSSDAVQHHVNHRLLLLQYQRLPDRRCACCAWAVIPPGYLGEPGA